MLEITTLLSSRGVRIGAERSVLPGAVASCLVRQPEGTQSLYALLGASGILVTTAEEWISSKVADEATGRLLAVAPGTALLDIRRLAFGIDQRPVELRYASYAASHVSYSNRIV